MFGPFFDEDPEIAEARSALRTLFEAEEIKMDQGDLLSRIASEIDRKRMILDKIELQLPEIEASGEKIPSMETFFDRLNANRRKNQVRERETPNARRDRISKGSLPKVVNGTLITEFN